MMGMAEVKAALIKAGVAIDDAWGYGSADALTPADFTRFASAAVAAFLGALPDRLRIPSAPDNQGLWLETSASVWRALAQAAEKAAKDA